MMTWALDSLMIKFNVADPLLQMNIFTMLVQCEWGKIFFIIK